MRPTFAIADDHNQLPGVIVIGSEDFRSRNGCAGALVGMHARSLCFTATLLVSAYARADSDTHIRAAYVGSDVARLTIINGGKKPGVILDLKGKGKEIYSGEAAATIEAGHGIVVIAVSIDAAKKP